VGSFVNIPNLAITGSRLPRRNTQWFAKSRMKYGIVMPRARSGMLGSSRRPFRFCKFNAIMLANN